MTSTHMASDVLTLPLISSEVYIYQQYDVELVSRSGTRFDMGHVDAICTPE